MPNAQLMAALHASTKALREMARDQRVPHVSHMSIGTQGPLGAHAPLNKKVNCWDTLTGNAEGNQQPSHAFDRTPAHGRFIDYPAREYPSSHVTDRSQKQGEALLVGNNQMI